MELFEILQPAKSKGAIPLAMRLAPRDWREFVGQEHLVSQGSPLRIAIESDRLGSSIFFGPPGTGKTALARLAAKKSNSFIQFLNAVTTGVADIRQVIKRAIEHKRASGRHTLLIIDEIHHFNRSQQDALLPDVERGNLTLIGLTTENPFFYVNAALMSRSTAYEFKLLDEMALNIILESALSDKDRGLGHLEITMTTEARKFLIFSGAGDARRLLNNLDLAVLSKTVPGETKVHLTEQDLEKACQKKALRYDKKGDEHYDTISAFIKSLRGSDPDAALYWMAKMLTAGEDPRFIARRLMIFAAEDVGNADPQGLGIASEAAKVVEMVGMPEARIPLAQAATYLACAPKSNAAYLGIEKALKEVENGPVRTVPIHLKDSTRDNKHLGHGKGYLYPHDFPDHFVKQEYLPDAKIFYEPTSQGKEDLIKKRLDEWRGKKKE